jgi:hypothetical protein
MDWRPISDIPGYEAFTNYILNITGELLNTKTGTTLKWYPTKKKEDGSPDGYYQAQLRQKPAIKHIHQHRAICCLFKPNPFNLPEVDHIDRKGLNNHIDNLRWATRLEQLHNQGIRIDNTSGESNIQETFNNDKPVWRIRMNFKGSEKNKYFPRDTLEIPQEAIDWRNKKQLEIQAKLEEEARRREQGL